MDTYKYINIYEKIYLIVCRDVLDKNFYLKTFIVQSQKALTQDRQIPVKTWKMKAYEPKTVPISET